MARKTPPPPLEGRSVNFNFRVSPAERDAIRRAAKSEDRKPSDYARRVVLAALRTGKWLKEE